MNEQIYDNDVEVAVLVSGQLRTLDVCIESIKAAVLDRVGKYDLFAHVNLDENIGKLQLLNAKKAVVTPQPLFDPKNYVVNNLNIKDTFGPDTRPLHAGIQNTLCQLWRLSETNKLKLEAERIRGKQYKWVIRLRPDLLFLSCIENISTLNPNYIYLPKVCNFFGYNDSFGFGGSKVMDVYYSRYLNLDIFPGFHPETMLKYVIDKSNIEVKRTDVTYLIQRKDGLQVGLIREERFGDVLE